MSLSISPDSAIGFTLARGDKATKSILKLENGTAEYFAFKVRRSALACPDHFELLPAVCVLCVLGPFAPPSTEAVSSVVAK